MCIIGELEVRVRVGVGVIHVDECVDGWREEKLTNRQQIRRGESTGKCEKMSTGV